MRRVHPVGWRYAHYVLSALCIGCALLLILLSLNGRTVWVEGSTYSPDAATIRDAAGWDWLARGAGLLAIITLGSGLYTSRRWLAIACTALATACLS